MSLTAKLILIDPLTNIVFSHIVYVGACVNRTYQTWNMPVPVICVISLSLKEADMNKI